jgi:hypothetical protein
MDVILRLPKQRMVGMTRIIQAPHKLGLLPSLTQRLNLRLEGFLRIRADNTICA